MLTTKTDKKLVAKKTTGSPKPLVASPDNIVILGNGNKTFIFKTISAEQQLKERNKSYQFFTID